MSNLNTTLVTNVTKSKEDYNYNQEQLLSSVASASATLAPQLQTSAAHVLTENPTSATVHNLGKVDPSSVTSTAMTSTHNQVSGVHSAKELNKDLPDHLPSLSDETSKK